MSGGSGNNKGGGGKRNKKKNKWKEAGGEFYQESFPAAAETEGQGGPSGEDVVVVVPTAQRKPPSQPHMPLPSQTARRSSMTRTRTGTGRRGWMMTRRESYTNTTTLNGHQNCMTYTSTMGRIQGVDEIHVPFEADETIPDQGSTYDALEKLRDLPEPMCQKRMRKEKLGAVPQRRLFGWSRITWELKKRVKVARITWSHDWTNFGLFQRSIRKIEERCGGAIAEVFLFIRWTLLLNLFAATIFTFFVILPFSFLSNVESPEGGNVCNNLTDWAQTKTDSNAIDANFSSDHEGRTACCTKEYHQQLRNLGYGPRDTLTIILNYINVSLEDSILFYGSYIHNNPASNKYDHFAVAYVLTIVSVLLVSLILMVKGAGVGIKEVIYSSEGEQQEYNNLIFAGWDHFTRDSKSALVKRKILRNEMKIALKNEKRTLANIMRKRADRFKLAVMRIVTNVIIFALAIGSMYLAKEVSEYNATLNGRTGKEKDVQMSSVVFVGFLPAITISALNLIFPVLLTKLEILEGYSTRTATALFLFRALSVRLLTLASAGVSLYRFTYCNLRNDAACAECGVTDVDNGDNDISHRPSCWENVFADQIYKFILVDFIFKFVMTYVIESARSAFNRCCPKKNKACRTVSSIKFCIIRHSLDIIYVQVLSGVGMFFSPFIPITATLYCFLVFCIKKFSVLNHCNDVPNTYRTTKTTMMFILAKLTAFLTIGILSVYILTQLQPSRGCGPFRDYDHAWDAVKNLVDVEPAIKKWCTTLASPGVSAPLVVVLSFAGYYYYSVAQANRGMVDTLRHLLILEGHDKQYLFARLNSLRQAASGENTNTLQNGGTHHDRNSS